MEQVISPASATSTSSRTCSSSRARSSSSACTSTSRCRIEPRSIDLVNQVRYFLPHILALSTSSPFWLGRNTGLKSYRTTIFRRFPRTGIPDHFGSWGEYQATSICS